MSLPGIGWIVGVYGFTWGTAQLATGRLSDHWNRQKPNVGGMWLCGGGVAQMLFGEGSAWWSMSAAVTGLGMATLYPNLSAVVADISAPHGALRPTALATSGAISVTASAGSGSASLPHRHIPAKVPSGSSLRRWRCRGWSC